MRLNAPMYYFRIRVEPTPENPHQEIDHAEVALFVEGVDAALFAVGLAQEEDTAYHQARTILWLIGWKINSVLDTLPIEDPSQLPADTEYRRHWDALKGCGRILYLQAVAKDGRRWCEPSLELPPLGA